MPRRGEVLSGAEAAATNGFGQREVTGDTANLTAFQGMWPSAAQPLEGPQPMAWWQWPRPRDHPRSKAGAPRRKPAGGWASTVCSCSGDSGSPSASGPSRCPRARALGLGLGSQGGQVSSAQPWEERPTGHRPHPVPPSGPSMGAWHTMLPSRCGAGEGGRDTETVI